MPERRCGNRKLKLEGSELEQELIDYFHMDYVVWKCSRVIYIYLPCSYSDGTTRLAESMSVIACGYLHIVANAY